MPEKTKLTVRIDREALARAKRYAADHNTRLSKLISDFFGLLNAERRPTPTPILDELTVILPVEASVDEHRIYLAKRFDP